MRNNFHLPGEGKILVFNKPVDWTSFDVVNKIKRLTSIKKVGHAGTLDPFATGVLLVCLGPATKLSSELMNLPKEYIAQISLGSETDTMDLTGNIITEKPVPSLSEEQINNVLKSFLGQIEQEIPAYSAAKYKGKRLYKLARDGKEVPRLFKKVQIYEISLLERDQQSITISVLCGRGTYIRTLARDIARKLDTAGHVKALTRTSVGEYHLKNALTIEEFQRQLQANESIS